MWASRIFAAAILCLSCQTADAQGYVDQKAVAPLLNTQGESIEVAPAGWHLYKLKSKGSSKAAMADLVRHLDSIPGGLQGQRLSVVELSNRVARKYLMQRREIWIPDYFSEDFRAYAPYPQQWDAAVKTEKTFIIDKYTQTFAAYEWGKLVRWGLVSTGADDSKTPTGRYSFNWKQQVRNSSEAPEGETWEMKWVFNFCGPKGLHVHQYSLPIAQNASHGCVRLTEADAEWNYNWAERDVPVLVLNYAPFGLASHWMDGGNDPVSLVSMPVSIEDVPLWNSSLAGNR